MVLDLCYICNALQGRGSGRQLLVARFTSASVSSAKAVQLLLCTAIVSYDLIGHSKFWE